MIILGIDPGYAIIGFGVIEKTEESFKVLEYGVIKTHKSEGMPTRLSIIYDSLGELIKKYNINDIAIEELFFYRNTKTAIAVAQARGVITLAASKHSGRIYEYTPMQVKQAITGHGHAEKPRVEAVVRAKLGIENKITPDDAADALAIAICHGQVNEDLKCNYIF